MAENQLDSLPYLDWSYSDENTLKVCLINPTYELTGVLYRGLSDKGRDFRGNGKNNNIFEEIATCNLDMVCQGHEQNGISVKDIGEGCYEFEDSTQLDEGRYTAMWFSVEFKTEYLDPEGSQYGYVQSTGPLVRPNTLPFDHCQDSSDVELTGLGKV